MKNEKFQADEAKENAQEKIFLERMYQAMHGKAEELEKAKAELELQLADKFHSDKESEQEMLLLNTINKNLEEKLSKSKVEENKITKEEFTPDPHQKIDGMLRIYKQITISRLSEFTNIDISEIQSYLKTLESQGIIVQLSDKDEIICPDCSSLNIEPLFQCPKCNGNNFKQATLIEHYDCGNLSLEESYIDDKCPNCKKGIKALGVDYRVLKEFFVCRDCQNRFQEYKSSFHCQHCNNKFNMADAKSKTSPFFKMK